MASGTIYGTTSNQYIECKIEWTSTHNNGQNECMVEASLYYRRTNTGYTTYGTGSFSIQIGNAKSTTTASVSIGESWVLVHTSKRNIDHSAGYSASITISATGSISGTTLTSTACSGTANICKNVLETEMVSIKSAYDQTFKQQISCRFKVKSSGVYIKMSAQVNHGGKITAVRTMNLGQRNSGDFTEHLYLTGDELTLIYNRVTDSPKAIFRVTIYTYRDSNYTDRVGNGQHQEITLNIPNDKTTQPTVSRMDVSPESNLGLPYDNLYIQGLSKVKADLEFGTKYGATVAASTITVNGTNYGDPYESGILYQAGTVEVKATVKDSRGFYGTYHKNIEVIPYEKPYVRAKSGETSIIAVRCDSSGRLEAQGIDPDTLTCLKIKAKVVYSKVIDANGEQQNYGKILFRYRKEGGAWVAWETIHDSETDKNQSDEVITEPLLVGKLAIDSNYQVQIIAIDYLTNLVNSSPISPITIAIPSNAVYMDRPAGGKSMGLGGYVPDQDALNDVLDIYWKTRARGGLSLVDAKGDEIPLNSTMPIPRDQIPENWNPDNVECGVYVVANNYGIQSGGNTIMSKGLLIQMNGTVGGNVKVQIALPVDTNKNPMYRICWDNSWSDWRSMKL